MRLLIAKPNRGNGTYSETFIQNQIKGLKPVRVITEGWYPSVDAESGRSFLPFPYSALIVRGGLRNLLPGVYHSIYSRFLAKYLVDNRIDTVLAEYGPMGVRIFDACRRAGVKLITHFHGFDASDTATLNTYGDWYAKKMPGMAAIITVSKDMQQQVLSFGVPAEKVFLNPYGVRTDQFYGAEPEKFPARFVYVGRFTEKKAPDLTIRAFAIVAKKMPSATLTMIGGGSLLEMCKALAGELGVSDRVDFKGVLGADEIAVHLRSASVFVQHSLRAPNGDSEGTPNTILEASATGLAIVSTRHAGIKEAVLHEQTGYLVEEGDWEKMGEYLLELAGDPVKAGKMGRAARAYMLAEYEMDDRIARLRSILEEK